MARTVASGRIASTRSNSILYNGNFEIAPPFTAATSTSTRWVDGTAGGSAALKGYGWGTASVGASSEAAFDSSVSRSGSVSLRLSTLNSSGSISIGSLKNNSVTAATLYQLFPLLANTSYTLAGYIKTNNVVTNAAFIDLRQLSATGATLVTTSSNKLSGTDTTFRQVTLTVTTNASAIFGAVFCRINVAGNVSDAWFDDITVIPNTIGRVAASGRVAV